MVPEPPSSRPVGPDSGAPQPRVLGPDRPPALPPGAQHIGLLVTDLAASTDFYARGLGVAVDPARSGPTFQALPLRDDVVLGLHTADSWSAHGLVPQTGAPARVLVAYRPASLDEVDERAGRLEDLGAAVVRDPHDAYGQRMALLTDRDGHLVCLTHPLPEGSR